MSLVDIHLDSICDTPFWDDTVTWNTTRPALTPCFTSTALVWLPSLFLLLCFPYTLFDYVSAKRVSIKWNRLNVFKLLTALTLVVFGAVHVVYVIVNWFADDVDIDKAEIIGAVISLVTYCLLAAFVHLQRVYGFVNGGVIWFYLLLQIICTALSIPTLMQFDDYKSTTERVLIYIELAVGCLLFLLCSFSDQIENLDELLVSGDLYGTDSNVQYKNNKKIVSLKPQIICPKETASFPSKLTFWWFNSIALLGFRRPLTIHDLWQIRVHDHTTNLFNNFNRYWKHKSFFTRNDKNEGESDQTASDHPKTNVISIIIRQFGLFFLYPCAFRFLTDNIQLINPIVVKYVISFVSNPSAPFWHGIFYTMVFVITNVVNSFTSAYQQHRMGILGMRIRTALLSAIYRKSLVLAMHSKKDYTTGEIINLMAVDCQRFIDLFPWLNFLWTAPVQIAIAIWLLWAELGVSVTGGLVLMLMFIPLQSYVGKWIKTIQEKQMALKDQRMKAINEMLNGIKVLKLYAWEEAFIENIQEIRVQELRYIRRSGVAFTIYNIMTYGAPFMVTAITFGIYILLDPNNQLTAEKAFVSVALFNMLRVPMAQIPNGITNLIMTLIAVKRINKFLNSDEIIPYVDRKVDNANSIVMSNSSFTWEQSDKDSDQKSKQLSNSTTLSNIDLTIPKGSLVAVVGSVGSGKSSLLYALLGEMHKLTGKLNISGDQRVAYVAQQAWIQNASLRENILFGTQFDVKKYHKIIEACALRTDLNILTAGDQTEIGEKGINLSGGQKQRVSIARACYSDADLYLFDDPLSAVDSHVGKHIFTEVLDSKTGILKNKTRILVTNALYMLPNVDQIVLLKNGTVDAVGNYEKLMKTNPAFHELILNYTNSSAEDQEEVKSVASVKLQNEEIQVLRERQLSTISSASRREKSFSESSKILDLHSQLVEEEQTQTGQVTLAVYKNFLNALSPFWSCCIVLGYFLMMISVTGTNVWLSVWTSDPEADPKYYLLIYSLIGGAYLILICFGWLSIVHGTLNASTTLHWKLISSIVHAPMYFFDTTPLGRIVNRFSKDIDVLDMYMTNNLRVLMNTSFTIVATMFVVSFQTPLFLAIVVPFIGMYLFIQRFYVSSSRQLKRLESVTRSPIFTHFSETINGVCTIKAYNATERFIVESDRRTDENQRCIYPNSVSLCWLQVRLEFMANCLIFFASLFAVLSKPDAESNNFDESGSGTGLSLSYALNITIYLNMCVRMFAELENNIVSVERISEYANVNPEAAWHTEDDSKLSQKWPEEGIIRFEQYGTRYRPGLDLVLKKIDFSTGRGEKIGIVGRTGAGKSSLTLALFRIIEAANGKIWMDGIDISDLGLQTLRSRITIIPQDPVLFCGTIRSNLDPFSTYSDDQLWHILELAHLKAFVSSLPQGLSHSVSEGGENLSVGQRQLICLARALLRRTRVLVLDEATAAVDLETDSLIQSTIRHQFAHCTVLTIAHRLHTILDSDRVMVLDAGNVAELDTPTNLLNDEGSIFYSLAKDAGIV